MDLYVSRQSLVNLIDFELDPLNNPAAVFAFKHHHNCSRNFTTTLHDNGTLPNFGAENHISHVPKVNWRPALIANNDGLQVFDVLDQPHSADNILLRCVLDKIAADNRIVVRYSFEHICK